MLKQNKHLFQFYLELDDENKEVPALLGLENYQIFPKDGSFSQEKWIADLPLFYDETWLDASYILVGNVISIQTFRKVLKNKGAKRISAQGYWLQGKKGL
ncbi:hypothetical protein SF1_10740 [Sphingobacterium faecium NBRC 15299]|nr:hypothetical protein SF1_10740 [Sphingobacterium faecium NBRC 15299]